MTTPEWMPLIEAGFTAEELRGIADDLTFGAVLAEAGEPAAILAPGRVEWTREKCRAWNALLGDKLGRVHCPEDDE
jgi:hypothetical protein